MRRSLLFIPGNTPSMLQNANLFKADTVIFDLEDAVGLTQKDSARNLVQSFLKANTIEDLEVSVRVNAVDTPFFKDDIDAVVLEGVAAIILPKAKQDDIIELDKTLEDLEEQRYLKNKIKIIPIIELAISLLEIEKIAAIPRVDGIIFGAEDFASDMEIERTPAGNEIMYARNKIAIACKAFNKDAIDTPFIDTTDESGLIFDAKMALSLGFNAKACIHPNQIETVNKIFSPSSETINYASQVLEKADQTSGVFSIGGRMVDKPIIERSQKIIEKAKKFGLISDEK